VNGRCATARSLLGGGRLVSLQEPLKGLFRVRRQGRQELLRRQPGDALLRRQGGPELLGEQPRQALFGWQGGHQIAQRLFHLVLGAQVLPGELLSQPLKLLDLLSEIDDEFAVLLRTGGATLLLGGLEQLPQPLQLVRGQPLDALFGGETSKALLGGETGEAVLDGEAGEAVLECQ
jgi:hypothetical protein